MSNTIALIPARAGSKGIPGKNFRYLGTDKHGTPITLVQRAVKVADATGACDRIVVTSDAEQMCAVEWLNRPAHLAQDDTPMLDVVQHAAETLQLADDDVIVLLQPTQPLRTPARVKEAIALLHESGADSVVSVVEVPRTHHPAFQFRVRDGRAHRGWSHSHEIGAMPATRQSAEPTYIRDGTVYAFWRKTLRSGSIYGSDVRPLIVSPNDTCELDTPEDWTRLEARWKERHG